MDLKKHVDDIRWKWILLSAGMGVACLISSLLVSIAALGASEARIPLISALSGLPLGVAVGLALFAGISGGIYKLIGESAVALEFARWSSVGWIMGLLAAIAAALEAQGHTYLVAHIMLGAVGFACYWTLVGRTPEEAELEQHGESL